MNLGTDRLRVQTVSYLKLAAVTSFSSSRKIRNHDLYRQLIVLFLYYSYALRYSHASILLVKKKNYMGDMAIFGGGRPRRRRPIQLRPASQCHTATASAASMASHTRSSSNVSRLAILVQRIVDVCNGGLPARAAFAAHAAALASFTRCARGIVDRRRLHA